MKALLAAAAALVVSLALFRLGGRGDGDGGEPAHWQGLGERLAALERRLAAGTEPLEDPARGRAAPPAASPADDPEVPGAGGEDEAAPRVETRLAALEARVSTLLERVDGLEDDPMSRGFSYLESQSDELRREGIRVLRRVGRFDPEARAAIRKLLADPSPRVRLEALEACVNLRDQESVAQVTAMLSDPEAMIRRQAVEALGDLQAREAAGSLAQQLLSETDGRVREELADVLGSLKTPEAAEALIKALKDSSDDVRGEAIASLGEVGAREAAPVLRALYDGDPGRHRRRLVLALRSLGDEQPFQEEVTRLSRSAASDPDERARRRAIEALSDLAGDAAAEVFCQMLQDPRPSVRQEAYRALRRRRT